MTKEMTILEKLCFYALKYALSEDAKISEQSEDIAVTTCTAISLRVDEFSSETLKVIQEEIENGNIDDFPYAFTFKALLATIKKRLKRKAVNQLLALGIPEGDIAQVVAAEKCVKCYINGKRRGKQEVKARLGERKYWNAMERAAFHWTASTTDVDGNEYSFDCRDYFKS